MDDRVYIQYRPVGQNYGGETSHNSTIEANYDPKHRGYWVKFNLTHGPITSISRFIGDNELKGGQNRA